MNIVLDTNVLVSGILSPAGPPGRIVDALQTGKVVTVVDDRILAEYSEVLLREKFSRWIAKWEAEAILQFLESEGVSCVSHTVVTHLPDPSDAPFLEVAFQSAAPLITGNNKHSPQDKRMDVDVLTPSEFCSSYLTNQT